MYTQLSLSLINFLFTKYTPEKINTVASTFIESKLSFPNIIANNAAKTG